MSLDNYWRALWHSSPATTRAPWDCDVALTISKALGSVAEPKWDDTIPMIKLGESALVQLLWLGNGSIAETWLLGNVCNCVEL